MTISESKFNSWSNQGATVSSASTYNSITTALNSFKGWTQGKPPDIHLQGSYRNSTNIRGDSDVDVVAVSSVYYSDESQLTASQKLARQKDFNSSNFTWHLLRADVLKALISYYGFNNVEVGKKTLKVKAGSGRLPADVVVANDHITYFNYPVYYPSDSIKGITFYVSTENRWVVNYPKQHYKNGASKNNRTNERYKKAPAAQLLNRAP